MKNIVFCLQLLMSVKCTVDQLLEKALGKKIIPVNRHTYRRETLKVQGIGKRGGGGEFGGGS